MFSNFSTVVFGQVLESVKPSLSYEWNARPRCKVRSSSGDQEPFTGSDFSDTPAQELELNTRIKWELKYYFYMPFLFLKCLLNEFKCV